MYNFLPKFYMLLCSAILFFSCQEENLHQVTVTEFSDFVMSTGYKTDAEKYGWTIVQLDIINYEILHGIDWRCPTGRVVSNAEDPVTQVSYNDAAAYAAWSDTRIPDYENYWKLAAKDNRPINFSSNTILPIGQVNILGNVWEITTPGKYGNIRLAGGSYLCDKNTCNGTSVDRELLVDKITGNSHIGFAVIK